MSRDQILPVPEKIYLQVALSGNGSAIASGTKKGVVPVPVAGTITAFRVDCDPANEPSAASIEVDLNTINRSTGTATSNSEGIAELSLVKGGLYYVWRSAATRPMNLASYRVLKADGTTPDATLALPSHVGA